MEITALTCNDDLWLAVADYASNCSWQPTGTHLSKCMRNNGFSDWERVFVALENNAIAGYCTLSKSSEEFGDLYCPNIGFVFIGEPYRGKRFSEKLCIKAIEYAESIGFDKVYLYSDHVNLYEKYGFTKIDEKDASWGAKQSIYMRRAL